MTSKKCNLDNQLNIFFFFCFLITGPSYACTFDPGPPPIPTNFMVADEIFTGEVKAKSPTAGELRGDTKIEIQVDNVWKGPLKPGEIIVLSYNENCPFAVRRSACVRHTLQIKSGEKFAFFTRGNPRYAAKQFGTRPLKEIEPALDLVKRGYSTHFAEAVSRKIYRENKGVIGSIVSREPVPIPTSTVYSGDSILRIKVKVPVRGNFREGDIIEARYRAYREYDKKDFFSYFSDLKNDYLFVFVKDTGHPWEYLEENTIKISELEKDVQQIEVAAKNFEIREAQRRSKKPSTGISALFERYTDGLFSIFYIISHCDFHIGLKWNPDE